MRKIITLSATVLLILMVLLPQQAIAQSPEGLSYQAIVRDSGNALLTELPVGVQISILQGSATGTAVYTETHTATTNTNGLLTLVIGTGSTADDFSSIDWANGPYFIKTETDPTGGTNYSIAATSQMLSVPYALYAKTAGSTQQATPTLTSVLQQSNSAGSQQIKNLADPTDAQDAVTKAYTYYKAEIDALIAGLQTQIDVINTATYDEGTVHCDPNNPTEVVDVINPITGKTWMDRNLGASQVATSSADAAAYGDLYQWGRFADGHQCRDSQITTTLSSTDQPTNGDFILAPNTPFDWRSPQNDNLWQGENGVNNPCPSGYRLPTVSELDAERLSWSSNNAAGAFASPLKLPMAGFRNYADNSIGGSGTSGYYWSSTVNNTFSLSLEITGNASVIFIDYRAYGSSVRCIKDTPPPPGAIGLLNCSDATNTGTLTANTAASGVSSNVPYTGGNSGTHSGQTVASTGVTGLTATLAAGTFANGSGTLNYVISGTPAASGTASFALSIGGQTCTLTMPVDAPGGTVYCTGTPTAVVDVTNPTTGKTWMDRNLGASRVAAISNDAAAYGDLYQWGRGADGHQCRDSQTTSTLSSTDQPSHGDFILAPNTPQDWRSPQNTNLWQGVNGVNNPCPNGYRLPTETELNAERLSWSSNNAAGAFASPLKLLMAGARDFANGSINFIETDTRGYYWSSTVSSTVSRSLVITNNGASTGGPSRAAGFSVRCIKN